MHAIFYYIIFFIIVGGAGMAIGSRTASADVKQQRWLKFFAYIFITGVVILAILYNKFPLLAVIIVAAALVELCTVNFIPVPQSFFKLFLSFGCFAIIAIGFLLFANLFVASFLLFIYFQVLVFDGFCQVSGQLFGKQRIATSVSPSKTWEGLAGGWLLCIAAAAMGLAWINLDWPAALVFGLISGFTGFIGDMLASWYKRQVHVKDYSKWLPGQGGFLDRFDSFLLTGAAYYLLYSITFSPYLKMFKRL